MQACTHAPQASAGRVYRPRKSRASALYQCAARHAPELKAGDYFPRRAGPAAPGLRGGGFALIGPATAAVFVVGIAVYWGYSEIRQREMIEAANRERMQRMQERAKERREERRERMTERQETRREVERERIEAAPSATAPAAVAPRATEPQPAPAPVAAANPARAEEQAQKVSDSQVRGLILASLRADLPEIDNQVKAMEAREKPAKGDRKEARRLNTLGLQQFGARDFDAAAQIFAGAVAADGSDQEIINNAGFALLEGGRLDQSEKYLFRALSIAPTRASAWINLGMLYAKRGDDRLAVGALQNGLRFTRDASRARTYFEKVLAEADGPTTQIVREAMGNVPLAEK